MNEDGFVLIGPNGWPILVIVVFMAFVGWWFAQSGKPPRQGPTFWEGVRWSALKAVFPGVHAWYVSSVFGGGEDEEEDEPRVMSREEKAQVPIPAPVPVVPVPGTNDVKAARPDDLTEDWAWEVIALAKDEKGRYKHSGKKLYATKGGSYPEFLAWLRQLRGDDRTQPPEEPIVYTPIAGRPTKASYYSEPELEYKEPPR